MISHRLDVPALYRGLDLVRSHRDLTWRDLSAITGVPASTFSRMAAGHKPNADALCSLIMWLRTPLDQFVTNTLWEEDEEL